MLKYACFAREIVEILCMNLITLNETDLPDFSGNLRPWTDR